MVAPAAAILIAAGLSAAAKGAGDYLSSKNAKKQGKLRSKAMKEETRADLFQSALQRSAELEAHRLASKGKLARRKGNAMNETSELVRGALNI